MAKLQWIVSQIGARQHYGIPRGFQRTGALRAFYTDAWCRVGRPLLAQGPLFTRSLAARYQPEIPGEKVVAFTPAYLYQHLLARRMSTLEDRYMEYNRVGRWFSNRVNQNLERQSLVPGQDAFFGFNTGSLETIEMMRSRDVLTVVDQIDPARVEEDLVYAETRKWTGWQDQKGRIPVDYFARLSREWQAADIVVVNSRWSKTALEKQGVNPTKIIIAPIAYEAPRTDPVERPRRGESPQLTVLWLGTVNLRKGIPYLIQAARTLAAERIRFVIAGPIEISREAVESAPQNISFLGRVGRSETTALYRSADLFVLPTISDGFAITQLEAMAAGLPVITTDHCGEVVTDGTDGLIVPAGSADGLATAILKLHRDRDLLRRMSDAARTKVGLFRLPRQTRHLENAIRDWVHNVTPADFLEAVD